MAVSASVQWKEYKALLVEHGEERRKGAWYGHYKALRARTVPARRLTREEHFAFWRERLTDREIREIGNSLDFITRSPFEPTLMAGVKVA